MADVKISALPASTTPLAGTEVLPIVQSGVTKKVSVADLTAGRAVSAASLTLTTSPLGVASGGTNQTAFTAKSGNVAGLVYFDGTSLATDATVTNVGYDTSTNTVQAKNFFASGTAVVTGNVTVNTNAAFVDATNKRLGVGTGSPTTALQVNSADRASFYIVSSDTGTSNQINIVNGSNFAAGTIGTYSGTGISGGDVWGLGYTTNPTGSDFTPILKWASAGDVTVSTGNLVIGTSDKGIDFSVTANSSGTMTSELLNDYEEGTWTATLTAGTTAPTTPITVTSKYTKIGRQVTVYANR